MKVMAAILKMGTVATLRKSFILLATSFPLMELYSFSPKKRKFHFYPCNPEKIESIRWYVTALADRTAWIIAMLVLWDYLRKKSPQIAPYFFIFVLYRVLDFGAYILNGGIAGSFYLIVYLPIIIYVLFLSFKKEIRSCGERIYSKINRNGNGS
jgi:hypothetical protein